MIYLSEHVQKWVNLKEMSDLNPDPFFIRLRNEMDPKH